MHPSRTLLPLLLVAAARAAAAQPAAPFLSVRSDAYDLWAPNRALLDASRAQLDSARAEFARYFPGPPPKLTVVVADTRDELARFDYKAIGGRPGEVLAWTVSTPRTITNGNTVMEMARPGEAHAGSTRSEIALLGNLSAAVAPAEDGRGSVVRFVHPRGAAEGVDLRTGDVVRGLNGRAVQTQKELLDGYAALAAGAPVRLDVERDGAARTVSFAKPAGEARGFIQAGPPGGAPAGAPGAPGGGGEPRILSHEAGHHLFGAYVRARLAAAGSAAHATPAAPNGEPTVTYGSALPDWLDEAGATLVESAGLRAERRKFVLDNFGGVIPLARLFAAEHPAMPGLRAMAQAQRDGAEPRPGPVSVRVRRAPDAMDPGMFYAQSMSVAEFLAEREGPTFLATVVDAVARGRSMDEVLAGARRLPHTVAELEREWTAWVAR